MLVSFSGVGIAFQGDVLLEDVGFRIDRRERVALVGRNGTGKSTLLKLLVGELEPDKGSINVASGAKIGYLRQQYDPDPNRTVIEEVQAARQAHLDMRSRLEDLERQMTGDEAAPEVLEEYALLQERLTETDAYRDDQAVEAVLSRMGFTPEEHSRPVSQLSGGERTRLALARLLLEEPDLLVLDEPTNHLDLDATEYLEKWLCGFPGSALIVSHDRAFLDAVADRVLELSEMTVTAYPGPFPKYLQLREEASARRAEVARRQQAEIDRLDEYVRRFMNSQRTSQARGRLKMMNRLVAGQVHAAAEERGIKGKVEPLQRSGTLVLEASKLSFGYPGLTLGRDLDWTVRIGERWGVIGENGAGKSTLVKTLLGQIPAVSGSVKLGSSVQFGFFSQDAAEMDLDKSPLDLLVWENDLEPGEARSLLGRFLISGDDVFRPIRTLSGGEKNKLALAQLTALRPNLLLLDEPTNHLDMDSREALAEILRSYEGTLILVSHDRWLLGQMADCVLDLKSGSVVQYRGSFGDYRAGIAAPAGAQKGAKSGGKGAQGGKQGAKADPAAAQMLSPKEMSPRELSKEIQRVSREVELAEDRVAALEAELAEVEAELSSSGPTSDILDLTVRHGQLQEAIEGSMAAWESLSLEAESLRAMQGGVSQSAEATAPTAQIGGGT